MFNRLFLFLLGLMPGLAFAGNLFEPAPGDKSVTLLAAIFGSLGAFGEGGADPMAAGIKAFNGGVLIIGGVLVAYTILAGTIGTAHDGEMLGKKFSSVWVPIRTALGTALVLPVIGGSYCTMQAIVGWLIVQGIGLADNVWSSFASEQNIKLVATQGLTSNEATALGYNLFLSNACMKAYNKALEEAIKDAPIIVSNTTQATRWKSRINAMPGDTYYYGPKGGGHDGVPEEACGKLNVPTSTTSMSSNDVVSRTTAFFNVSQAGAAEAAVLQAIQTATNTLDSDMASLADSLVSSKGPIDPTQIDAAIKRYQDTVSQAATAQAMSLSNFNTLSANATADGWFMAGAFYTKIAFLTDVVQRAMSNMAHASGPTKMSSVGDGNALMDYIDKYNRYAQQSIKGSKAPSAMSFGINAEAEGGDDWTFDTVINKLFGKAMLAEGMMIDDKEHPLIAMKRIGNWLLGIIASSGAAVVAISMLSAGAKASIIGKAVDLFGGGVVSATGKVVDFIKDFWLKILLPILAVGIFLSYILPMMPYMLWLGATIGWLIMSIEAIIAAPMWAVMHLTANGDDMVGSGGQGYRLVLSLMLRPVLMIFGLIAAFVVINVLGQLVTQVFFGVFAVAQSDSGAFIKLVGLIVAPIMYAFAMYQVIIRSFHLIHMIPDELLKWFGGGGTQLGNMAEQMGGESARGWQQMGNAANLAATGALAAQMANKENKAVTDKFKGDLGLNDSANKAVNAGTREMGAMNRGKLGSVISSLGGVETEDGARFMRSFNESTESGQSFSEAMKTALDHTNEMRYGEGSTELINRFSGGDYASPEYKGVTAALNNKLGKFLQQSGGDHDSAKQKMSQMVSEVIDRHDTEGGSLGKILKEVSSKYNDIEPDKDTGGK